jgi:hypothetical protein
MHPVDENRREYPHFPRKGGGRLFLGPRSRRFKSCRPHGFRHFSSWLPRWLQSGCSSDPRNTFHLGSHLCHSANATVFTTIGTVVKTAAARRSGPEPGRGCQRHSECGHTLRWRTVPREGRWSRPRHMCRIRPLERHGGVRSNTLIAQVPSLSPREEFIGKLVVWVHGVFLLLSASQYARRLLVGLLCYSSDPILSGK